MLPRRFKLAVTLGAVALLATAFVACGDDDDDGDSAGASNADVIAAINILDTAGLHGIDESINDDKTIPSNAQTVAQKLQAVTELTEWPEELQGQADALAKIFADMAAALDGESPDLAKAGEAVGKAHDGEHDFSHEVWAHLYKEAGVTSGGDSHN